MIIFCYHRFCSDLSKTETIEPIRCSQQANRDVIYASKFILSLWNAIDNYESIISGYYAVRIAAKLK